MRVRAQWMCDKNMWKGSNGPFGRDGKFIDENIEHVRSTAHSISLCKIVTHEHDQEENCMSYSLLATCHWPIYGSRRQ